MEYTTVQHNRVQCTHILIALLFLLVYKISVNTVCNFFLFFIVLRHMSGRHPLILQLKRCQPLRNLKTNRICVKAYIAYQILYSIILYRTLLFSAVLYCSVLNCTKLPYSILLYSILLYCISLYCIVPYCAVLYSTEWSCTVLNYIVRH